MSVKGGGTRMGYGCAFCDKNEDQVRHMVAGPGNICICEKCIDLCYEIVNHNDESSPPVEMKGGTA